MEKTEKEKIDSRAMGIKNRYGIDSIKVIDEILDELNELFNLFDRHLNYGPRNVTLAKINFYKKVRLSLKDKY